MRIRLLSSLLALTLLLALIPAAQASTLPKEEDAVQLLAVLDIMVGDQDGNLNLDRAITRAEFTKLLMAASPQRDNVGNTASVSPYPDVPRQHWAAPYVQAAVAAGYVNGYLDGTFRPSNHITLAEGVTMALRLLGYQNSDFSGAYPAGQMALYQNLELHLGITATQDSAMTRRDAMFLFYHLMTTKTKASETGVSTYYLNLLEPGTVNDKGVLDMVSLVNTVMEGPITAGQGWQNEIPFDLSGVKVYRGGAASSLSNIQTLDIIYWSKPMRALWVYDDKITGTLEEIGPSSSSPSSVTVSGRTYSIESTGATYDLSDLGPYQVGDNVTLLLGRDGGVAAVRKAEQVSREIYGIITHIETKTYTNSTGERYNSTAVTICSTGGDLLTYPITTQSFQPGTLVRATPAADGMEIKRLSSSQLNGKVSSDGTRLGEYPLAADVQILDTYRKTGAALRVYPSRLAGISMEKQMVLFYALNTQGEISHLILNDVTGDLHSYGMITSVTKTESSGTCTYDVQNSSYTWVSADRVVKLDMAPCQIKGSLNAPEQILNLNRVHLDRIQDNLAFSTGNQRYTISDSIAVYLVEHTDIGETRYIYTNLPRVISGEYLLTGYYDKPEREGGRIRVILARPTFS